LRLSILNVLLRYPLEMLYEVGIMTLSRTVLEAPYLTDPFRNQEYKSVWELALSP
ncbi:hypothetical protein CU098_011922, partial [Rhizopus stolonifer]